jgi:amidophosphoribosyltransferase
MCGIVGLVSEKQSQAAIQIYEALTIIQHRGQDAAGIATVDGRHRLHLRKDNGLVRDVFREENMAGLEGHLGLGHCRYPTAGTSSNCESQPFYVNSPYGVVLAHNGNLTNADQLKQEVFQNDLRHLNTESDSEVLLNVLAHELAATGSMRLEQRDIFDAVRRVHERVRGGYAVVALILGHGLLAFRDPHGIRPLILGQRRTLFGSEYMVASESVALTALGFQIVRDIRPGEAAFIDLDGNCAMQQCADQPRLHPCLFEYVYLARPDSVMDGISVYTARLRMGEFLAKKILAAEPKPQIDVVIPIPDTSRSSALPIASALGVPYREGFIKNRYIGRTFILPGQKARTKSIKQKLNPIAAEFQGRNVLLVDDSIVRGNTSTQIVQMAREAGARKVYMASAAPPVKHQNVYGIDIPTSTELVAHNKTVDQICREIGADWLIYQDLEDLQRAVCELNPEIVRCESCCFDGEYVTGGIQPEYLRQLELQRNEANRR